LCWHGSGVDSRRPRDHCLSRPRLSACARRHARTRFCRGLVFILCLVVLFMFWFLVCFRLCLWCVSSFVFALVVLFLGLFSIVFVARFILVCFLWRFSSFCFCSFSWFVFDCVCGAFHPFVLFLGCVCGVSMLVCFHQLCFWCFSSFLLLFFSC
jgi:hypothetical protein